MNSGDYIIEVGSFGLSKDWKCKENLSKIKYIRYDCYLKDARVLKCENWSCIVSSINFG